MTTDKERKLGEELGLLFKKPMPRVVPYYLHDDSEYPEQLRASFEDGSTAIYDLRVEQPAPVILENIKIIRRMKQGYVNKPLRRRGRK